MKKLVAFMFVTISELLAGSSLFAQNHILITELVVTPTPGEFIEIYNPIADSVDLTNYYLTDEVFNNNNNYITIVEGGFTASRSDFIVKFPDGVKVGPGDYITVAFSGIGFMTEYGVVSDFEIIGDDAGIPDMAAVSVGGSAGLSNSGEVIILFYWDGLSDLVKDVDIVVWGDQKEAVDKTGVSIDGPDADTNSTEYLPDTPIAAQFVVNADNDEDEVPHDSGMSAQRRLEVEDVENWAPPPGGISLFSQADGNGITGHDETSENTSWKGGIWSINEPPTPGARALGGAMSLQPDGTIRPDILTIADVQFVRAESITAMTNDASPFLGDMVTVTGIVAHEIRDIFLGSRWGFFVHDEHGGPWSGFFVIQDDSTITGTGLNAAEAGDKIRMTGVVSEFPPDANVQSITQFQLLLDPVTPVEFIRFGLTLPEPILLKPGDLGATGSSEDPRLTERWESTFVRFENLTVFSNFPGQPGNIMTAGDETGTIAIDDCFLNIRQFLDSNQGVWPGFSPGTKINITGFVRDVLTGGVGRTTINPRSFDDITVTEPPGSCEINPVFTTPQVIGTEFWVDISVSSVQNLFGVSFELQYTSTNYVNVVTPTSNNVIPGTFLSSNVVFFSSLDKTAGKLSIGISRKAGQGGVSGSGTVARIRFKSLSSTPPGTNIVFSLSDITANDPSGNPINLTPSTATLTLAGLTVWPGDTNNDGIVNQADVLPIGLYWNYTGPTRQNATTSWVGQVAMPWSPEKSTYADANGSGIVNQADVLPIGLNWNRTHSTAILAAQFSKSLQKSSMVSTTSLKLQIDGDANPGDEFWVEIHAEEVPNLFGISYELVYSPKTNVTPLTVESGSWLGTDVVFFSNIDTTVGKVGVGISRKAGQGGVAGTGMISRIKMRMSNAAVVGQDTTWLSIDNVQANDSDGIAIQFDVVNVTLVPLITDINSSINNVPEGFVLYSNYPNPFNPATKIQFDLPNFSHVRIEIYNMLGQKIRTLVNEERSAGSYSVFWDGHKDNGEIAASGVYIYRLKANEFDKSMKLLLLR